MFADPMAELLARIEALEAAVFAKAPKPAKEAIEPLLGIAWAKWESYRSGRKGWTAEARSLSMRTLRQLAGTDGALALQIVEQSIEFGYQGLFPLKADRGGRAATSATTPLYKPAAEAMKPAESKRDAHLGWLRQQLSLGAITQSEFNAEAEKARERMG